MRKRKAPQPSPGAGLWKRRALRQVRKLSGKKPPSREGGAIAGQIASTSVVDLKRHGEGRKVQKLKPCGKGSAEHFELFGRKLSTSLVGDQFEGDLVAFAQLAQARALDGADMDESVLAAVIRHDKAETFFGVKPLYGSLGHGNPFSE
jgi:hypothetical protein